MRKYELVISPVGEPDNEQTVIVEAENPAYVLVKNYELYPGTYVKSWRDITDELP